MKIPILGLQSQYASLNVEMYEAIDRVLESGVYIMEPDVKLLEQELFCLPIWPALDVSDQKKDCMEHQISEPGFA